MGRRTFHFYCTCKHTTEFNGDIDSRGNKTKVPGSYISVSREEFNIMRAKVTRNGIVRYSTNIPIGHAKGKVTYN